MRNFETDSPSLFERCFAAVFSGLAAGATYATWLIFNTGSWGVEQEAAFKEVGKWIVLAGAALGFLGGISLIAWLWSEVWNTSNQPLFSLRTAFFLLVLVSIAYGISKHLPQ